MTESDNTGCQNGLWQLLREQLGKDILTFWCSAHRSDLAIEAVAGTFPELAVWKSNLLDFISFFRTPRITKLLHKEMEGRENVKQFPLHHDFRFAQHQLKWWTVSSTILPVAERCWKTWLIRPPAATKRKLKLEVSFVSRTKGRCGSPH